MNRRHQKSRASGISLGHLFGWTALLAIVFSVGIIMGQRLLIERSLPPIVSVGDQPKELGFPTAVNDDVAPSEGGDLFSFYEALTTSEAPEVPFTVRNIDELRAAEDAGDIAAHDKDTPNIEQVADTGEEPNTVDGSTPARFTLQIASHPSLERARAEMDRLRALGLDPHVVAADIPGQGKFYRVRIGKYSTEDEARAYQRQIQNRFEVQTFLSPL